MSFKFRATYSDGRIYEKQWDGDTILTTGDTKPDGYDYTQMVSAEIGDGVTELGNQVFRSFPALESITMTDSVTTLGTYSLSMLGENIKEVRLSQNITHIGQSAFSGSFYLEGDLVFPNVIEVGQGGFGNLQSINSITLGKNLTSLGAVSLIGLSNIEYVAIEAVEVPTGLRGAVGGSSNYKMYVPDESVEVYREALGTYAENIDLHNLSELPKPVKKITKIQISGETYEIGGSGGGSSNIVSLSQQEYDDLQTKDEDTLYVINDAEEVDTSNFATKGELSSYATKGELSDKQDKLDGKYVNSVEWYYNTNNYNHNVIHFRFKDFTDGSDGFNLQSSIYSATINGTNVINNGQIPEFELQEKMTGNYLSKVDVGGSSISIETKAFKDESVQKTDTINFKTINGNPIFGMGDIKIEGGVDTSKFVTKDEFNSTIGDIQSLLEAI